MQLKFKIKGVNLLEKLASSSGQIDQSPFRPEKFPHFRDIDIRPRPASVLSLEEITVLMRVFEHILSGIEQKCHRHFTRGTIILDCQAYGELATCVLRCHLRDGIYHCLEYDGSSDQLAEEAIDTFLDYPDNYSHPAVELVHSPQTCAGVRIWNYLRVMALNVVGGRFIFTAYLHGDGETRRICQQASQVSYALMLACANALKMLRPDDPTLQDSIRLIHASCPGTPYNSYAIKKSRDLVAHPISGLTDWQQQHQIAVESGTLAPFFGSD